MGNEVYEILAEYYIVVSGMPDRVKAKVCKIITDEEPARYTYSFSHYYLPNEDAQFYLDETIVRHDFEQAKIIALQYLKNFTIEFGEPQVNKFY